MLRYGLTRFHLTPFRSSLHGQSQSIAALRGVRLPSRNISSSVQNARLRQQHHANLLYEHGVSTLYTAPSHRALLAFTYGISAYCFGSVIALFGLGHYDVGDRMTGLRKTVVESGYRLGMIFFGFVGWLTIIRYMGLVKSMELVQKSGNAVVKFKVRRWVPILPPRELFLPAWDLQMPPYWRGRIENMPYGSSDLRRRGFNVDILKSIRTAFAWFKRWVFRDDMAVLKYNEGDKSLLLDMKGDFTNRGTDLWELTTPAAASRTAPKLRAAVR